MNNSYQYDGTEYPKLIGDSVLSKKLEGAYSISKLKIEEVKTFLSLFITLNFSQFDWSCELQEGTIKYGCRNQPDLQTGNGHIDFSTGGLDHINLSNSITFPAKVASGIYSDGTTMLGCDGGLSPLPSVTKGQDWESKQSLLLKGVGNTDVSRYRSTVMPKHRLLDDGLETSASYNELNLFNESGDGYLPGLDDTGFSNSTTTSTEVASGIYPDSITTLNCDDGLDPLAGMVGTPDWESGQTLFSNEIVNTSASYRGDTVISGHNLLGVDIKDTSHFNGRYLPNERGDSYTAGLNTIYTSESIAIRGHIGTRAYSDVRCDSGLNTLTGIAKTPDWETEQPMLNEAINTDTACYGGTVLAKHRLLEDGVETSASYNGLNLLNESGDGHLPGLDDADFSNSITIFGEVASGIYPDGITTLNCDDGLDPLAGMVGTPDWESGQTLFSNEIVNTGASWHEGTGHIIAEDIFKPQLTSEEVVEKIQSMLKKSFDVDKNKISIETAMEKYKGSRFKNDTTILVVNLINVEGDVHQNEINLIER